MNPDFMQFCYVTNDFDRAIAAIREANDMGEFKQMHELSYPTGQNSVVIAHVGLAFKAGLQFEIIQPLAEDVSLYQQVLGDGEFEIVFHHLGRYISSESTYLRTLKQAKASWAIPIEVSALGGHYAYADARKEFGHYLEYFNFPSDSPAIEAPHY